MRQVTRKNIADAMKQNMLDKIITYLSPAAGLSRMHAKTRLAIAGGYIGARRDRRETQNWITGNSDPDSMLVFDLPELRNRSRDLVRNNPIATGAIGGTVTSVIGTGLKLHAQIDREVLNLSVKDADEWERRAQREFALWAVTCDIKKTLNFAGMQELAFRQVLENGDSFILLPRQVSSDSVYSLKLQLIEADRVSNKDNVLNDNRLSAGIQKNKFGAPTHYHIMRQHPGNMLNFEGAEWDKVPAFGSKTGMKNIIHLYRILRPGQTRGIPYLAPVIETLKQLSRYTEAELMATVVSSMFTVFITSEDGESGVSGMGTAGDTNAGKAKEQSDILLDTGNIVDLAPGEKVSFADPSRPNTSFDDFVQAVVRQVGMALEIPFEVLIKHFSSSFSASKAALLEAWKLYNNRRKWMADNFCQVIYEAVITEAIAMRRLPAPGFFDDPLMKRAYLSAQWTGDAPGQLDPVKEVNAAEKRISLKVSTLQEETVALTGGDWEKKFPQIVKEHNMQKEAGLLPEQAAAVQEEQDVDKEDNTDNGNN